MGARRAVKGAELGAGWLIAVSGALWLGGCRPAPAPQNPPPSASAPQSAPAVTDVSTAAQAQAQNQAQNAQAWWKRTVEAQKTIPVRASVVVTRFHGGGAPPTISRYEMVEAPGGRKYRITYHAPVSALGRIVLCDGKMIWQYEPDHNTVLRRPVPLTVDAFASSGEAADTKAPSVPNPVVRLEPDADSVAGRPTRVLDLLADAGGPVVERRWIDTKTGRALRTERYDAQSKPWRRVEMTQVEFSPTVPADEFVAAIVEGTRVIDADHSSLTRPRRPRRDAEAAARRAHLGFRVRDFTLESAAKRSASPGARSTTHLTYTNGTVAISIFVTPIGVSETNAARTIPTKSSAVAEGSTSAVPLFLRGAAGWKPTVFPTGDGTPARSAWTQETARQSAIVWTQNHDRMVAVAQMPVRDLLPIVGTLASGSDSSRPPK